MATRLPASPNGTQLSGVLERVAAICREFQVASLQPQIDACRGLLAEEAGIDVAVIGGFKAGKSSFLNSLAGAPVLPVGVVPVTAVITRLCYGPHEEASVRHQDGRLEPIPLNRLSEFVAESRNPCNQKHVSGVTVRLPALKAYEGLSFIDTPGLGAVHRHGTETSWGWLPNAGVALVATSADHPLSEQDVSLIREASKFTPHLAILLTKADLLSDSQLTEAIDFIRKHLGSLGLEAAIYPYSIRMDLAAHQQRLQQGLLGPLARGKDEMVKAIARHKVSTLVAECIGYLAVGLAAAKLEDARRKELKTQVLGEQDQLAATLTELRILVGDCVSHTYPWVLGVLEPHCGQLHQKLRTDLLSKLPGWRMNLWRLCRTYEAWVAEILGREVAAVSAAEENAILGPLRQAESRINRHMGNFRTRLAESLEKALGIRMPPTTWKIHVEAPAHPDISVTPSFDIHIDLLWFLIPMRLFGPLVRRHFIRQLPWEAEKNLARLTAQWAEKINRKITEMEGQAGTLIRDEIATVTALLAQQPDRVHALESVCSDLARAKERLLGRPSDPARESCQ